jgi:hypothetical protein
MAHQEPKISNNSGTNVAAALTERWLVCRDDGLCVREGNRQLSFAHELLNYCQPCFSAAWQKKSNRRGMYEFS